MHHPTSAAAFPSTIAIYRHFTLAIAALVASCLWLGCATSAEELALERAREIAQQAQTLGQSDERASIEEGIRLLQAELDKPSSAPRAQALMQFVLGWLRYRLAGEAGGDEAELMKAAAAYEAVLEALPDHAAARANMIEIYSELGKFSLAVTALTGLLEKETDGELAYSIRIDIGDLYAKSAETSKALGAYGAAFAQLPSDDTAPERIVALAAAAEDHTLGGQLVSYCDRFAASGAVEVALAGVEILIGDALADPDPDRDADAPASYIEKWADIAATHDRLSSTHLSRLASIGPSNALITELARVVRLLKGTEDLKNLVDPRVPRDATDPIDASKLTVIEHWAAPPTRRAIMAKAMQSVARRMALEASDDATVNDRVARIYDRAMRFAPRTWRRDEATGDYVQVPGFAGRPDVRLDIAIDLAVFLHTHAKALDAKAKRFDDLIVTELSEEIYDRVPRSEAETLKYFGLLGLVYGEKAQAGGVSRGTSADVVHRERAIRFLSRLIKEHDEPLPQLSERLAETLASADRPVLALERYLEAAQGYIASDARDFGVALLPPARVVARQNTMALGDRIRELEALLDPELGLYVGGAYGLTDGSKSDAELQDELSRNGHDTTVGGFDDNNHGWKAFIGYDLEGPFALELGYTWQEGPSSTITENTSSPNSSNLVRDVQLQHPIAGEGPTLSLVAYPYVCDDFAVFARVGMWYWKSQLDVTVVPATGSRTMVHAESSRDLDPYVGLGGDYHVTEWLSARLEYERYFLNDDTVDMWSLGLLLKF